MNRLTDMYDNRLIPQIIEQMHTELIQEQDKYIARRLMELDIDKDILINQVNEIKRLNAIIEKDNELEEQGLLLRLPCKIGDTVYTACSWGIESDVVGAIDIISDMIFARNVVGALIGDIRNVFLTREEAEKALKERNGEK